MVSARKLSCIPLQQKEIHQENILYASSKEGPSDIHCPKEGPNDIHQENIPYPICKEDILYAPSKEGPNDIPQENILGAQGRPQ